MQVRETKGVYEYLKKRNLEKQYKKAKQYLLDDHFKLIDFKVRHPKHKKFGQFKINDKYSLFGYRNI